MATRRPSPEERALWHSATRDVQRRRAAASHNVPPEVAVPARDATAQAAATRMIADHGQAARPGSGLDRRSAQRLRRGEMPIEARLDLHGMTQDEAHRALHRFIARMHEEGKRAVLVITGKGTDSGGVLRQGVPRWLAEPARRAAILKIETAQPRHGGSGALYVLLRRRR